MTNAPVPYNMTNDNTIMLLFILNIIGISYVILMNGTSIIERAKALFYYQRSSTPFNDRTHITKICNALMHAQTILYLTIITIAELQKSTILKLAENAIIYTVGFALFYLAVILAKRGIYDLVNNILFTKKESQEWTNTYFFTMKLLGFALTPATISLLFIPEINIKSVNFYLLLTLIAYICTIITGLLRIIFTKNRNYLEIFLYLCALEFLPIAMAWKSVLQLSEFITIKI